MSMSHTCCGWKGSTSISMMARLDKLAAPCTAYDEEEENEGGWWPAARRASPGMSGNRRRGVRGPNSVLSDDKSGGVADGKDR